MRTKSIFANSTSKSMISYNMIDLDTILQSYKRDLDLAQLQNCAKEIYSENESIVRQVLRPIGQDYIAINELKTDSGHLVKPARQFKMSTEQERLRSTYNSFTKRKANSSDGIPMDLISEQLENDKHTKKFEQIKRIPQCLATMSDRVLHALIVSPESKQNLRKRSKYGASGGLKATYKFYRQFGIDVEKIFNETVSQFYQEYGFLPAPSSRIIDLVAKDAIDRYKEYVKCKYKLGLTKAGYITYAKDIQSKFRIVGYTFTSQEAQAMCAYTKHWQIMLSIKHPLLKNADGLKPVIKIPANLKTEHLKRHGLLSNTTQAILTVSKCYVKVYPNSTPMCLLYNKAHGNILPVAEGKSSNGSISRKLTYMNECKRAAVVPEYNADLDQITLSIAYTSDIRKMRIEYYNFTQVAKRATGIWKKLCELHKTGKKTKSAGGSAYTHTGREYSQLRKALQNAFLKDLRQLLPNVSEVLVMDATEQKFNSISNQAKSQYLYALGFDYKNRKGNSAFQYKPFIIMQDECIKALARTCRDRGILMSAVPIFDTHRTCHVCGMHVPVTGRAICPSCATAAAEQVYTSDLLLKYSANMPLRFSYQYGSFTASNLLLYDIDRSQQSIDIPGSLAWTSKDFLDGLADAKSAWSTLIKSHEYVYKLMNKYAPEIECAPGSVNTPRITCKNSCDIDKLIQTYDAIRNTEYKDSEESISTADAIEYAKDVESEYAKCCTEPEYVKDASKYTNIAKMAYEKLTKPIDQPLRMHIDYSNTKMQSTELSDSYLATYLPNDKTMLPIDMSLAYHYAQSEVKSPLLNGSIKLTVPAIDSKLDFYNADTMLKLKQDINNATELAKLVRSNYIAIRYNCDDTVALNLEHMKRYIALVDALIIRLYQLNVKYAQLWDASYCGMIDFDDLLESQVKGSILNLLLSCDTMADFIKSKYVYTYKERTFTDIRSLAVYYQYLYGIMLYRGNVRLFSGTLANELAVDDRERDYNYGPPKGTPYLSKSEILENLNTYCSTNTITGISYKHVYGNHVTETYTCASILGSTDYTYIEPIDPMAISKLSHRKLLGLLTDNNSKGYKYIKLGMQYAYNVGYCTILGPSPDSYSIVHDKAEANKIAHNRYLNFYEYDYDSRIASTELCNSCRISEMELNETWARNLINILRFSGRSNANHYLKTYLSGLSKEQRHYILDVIQCDLSNAIELERREVAIKYIMRILELDVINKRGYSSKLPSVKVNTDECGNLWFSLTNEHIGIRYSRDFISVDQAVRCIQGREHPDRETYTVETFKNAPTIAFRDQCITASEEDLEYLKSREYKVLTKLDNWIRNPLNAIRVYKYQHLLRDALKRYYKKSAYLPSLKQGNPLDVFNKVGISKLVYGTDWRIDAVKQALFYIAYLPVSKLMSNCWSKHTSLSQTIHSHHIDAQKERLAIRNQWIAKASKIKKAKRVKYEDKLLSKYPMLSYICTTRALRSQLNSITLSDATTAKHAKRDIKTFYDILIKYHRIANIAAEVLNNPSNSIMHRLVVLQWLAMYAKDAEECEISSGKYNNTEELKATLRKEIPYTYDRLVTNLCNKLPSIYSLSSKHCKKLSRKITLKALSINDYSCGAIRKTAKKGDRYVWT